MSNLQNPDVVKIIIVDSREQLPIWDFNEKNILKLKLDEGDYTTTALLHKAHIERKSGNDLYGSLIQGHIRFRNELLRAQSKNLKLAVFVECPKETFISKRFPGGWKLKTPPSNLRKMLITIADKYDVNFVFCDNRMDMKEKMLLWFDYQNKRLN